MTIVDEVDSVDWPKLLEHFALRPLTKGMEEAEDLVKRTKGTRFYEVALRELNGWRSGFFRTIAGLTVEALDSHLGRMTRTEYRNLRRMEARWRRRAYWDDPRYLTVGTRGGGLSKHERDRLRGWMGICKQAHGGLSASPSPLSHRGAAL